MALPCFSFSLPSTCCLSKLACLLEPLTAGGQSAGGGERWMCSPSTPTCPPTVSLSLDTSLQAAKDGRWKRGGGLAEGWAGTARSILSALGLVWDQMLVHTRHLVHCFVLLCMRSSEMSSPTASMFCSHEKGMPNLLLLLPSLPFASVAEEGDWGRLWCCSRW